MRLYGLVIVVVTTAVVCDAGLAPGFQAGVVLGSGEWSSPNTTYGSSASNSALSFVEMTGATHVRLLVTWYQDNVTSTVIRPMSPPSPLASATEAELLYAIEIANSSGLKVFLCPILDPNWDIVSNQRGSIGDHHVWRGMIGDGFSDTDWGKWFTSYTAFVKYAAGIAAAHPAVDMFGIASELREAFTQEARWRDLIAAVRGVYSGSLTIETGDPGAVTWWDALDYIGVDAYGHKGTAANDTVAAMFEAWQPGLASLAALSRQYNKSVVVTELGFQSRPGCFHNGANQPRPDQNDCSGWLECYDMACQANAYDAILRALAAQQSVFAGLYMWGWTTEPTHGGTCDPSFTPFGKPAEDVLRRWYGGRAGSAAQSAAAIASSLLAAGGFTPAGDTAGFHEFAPPVVDVDVARRRAAALRASPVEVLNGFVFGGPDEWSSPYYRYDSSGAAQSLTSMVEQTGANSVEIPVMWYYVNNSDPSGPYPITDYRSSLRTSTDAELTAIIRHAQSLNLTTTLTPMIDPDYDLPGNCRQCPSPPGPGWRGTVGEHWGTECSPGTPWAAWFDAYSHMIKRYAVLAEGLDVSIFLVSHELQTATAHCPALWADLITKVRDVFTGQVSVAFNAPIITGYVNVTWGPSLDFVGVDCYYAHNVSHTPSLPWEDATGAAIAAAWEGYIADFTKMATAWGSNGVPAKVVCTEVGYQSRPWVYSTVLADDVAAQGHQLSPHDCSVWDQCFSPTAQGLAMEGLLSSFYAQAWFRGFQLWMWRADPTAGGVSDDAFTVSGKAPSTAVLRKFWAA